MEIEIKYIILSMILSSFAVYLVFANYYIGKGQQTYKLFICQIVAYSSIIMVCSILSVLKVVFEDFKNGGHSSLHVLAVWICVLMVIVAVYVNYYSIRQGKLTLYPFGITGLINISIFLTFLVSNYSYKIYYELMVVFFSLVSLTFCWRAIVVFKHWRNVGVYYILAPTVSLLICKAYLNFYSDGLVVAIELGLITFTVVGQFIFYNNYYVGEIDQYISSIDKKTKRLEHAKNKMEKLIHVDGLTQLQNRTSFEEKVKDLSNETYIILINVENFMKYNNLLGFSEGNELLIHIANKIQAILPEKAELFRFYSDKFLLCIENIQMASLDDFLNNISRLFHDDKENGLSLQLNYGVLFYNPNSMSKDIKKINYIINAVEIASSEAKRNPDNRYVFSEDDMTNYKNLVNLELEMKRSNKKEDFQVFYQPQVDSNSLEIISYEALIRWKVNGKYVSPGIFIPMAEAKGEITPITYFVIRQVFEDIALNDWLRNERVSINLSAVQLIEPELITYIESMKQLYPGCQSFIVFEITETTLFNDVNEVRENIRKLTEMGFKFSLDDFGSGYSSLYRFAQLDLEEVKFDKVFLHGIESEPKIRMTFEKTIELFKLFGMRIVVEGVETTEQLNILKEMDIDVYQGFLFYKPMPLHRILTECLDSTKPCLSNHIGGEDDTIYDSTIW